MLRDVRSLSPAIGSIVSGLDLARDADEPLMRSLIQLLFERGVIVIKGQSLTDGEYLRFGRFWGRPLQFFIPGHRKSDYPEIIRIDNNPSTPVAMRDGAVHWHSDSSYEAVPASVTMLYGVLSPLDGGVTEFASTSAAYDALPEEMKVRLEGYVAIHELGKAPWIEGETMPHTDRPAHGMPQVRHRLVMAHPVTGRKGIFTSGTACGIEGMPDGEATELIRALRNHVIRPEFRTAYKVMPGDVVLWDNFGTVHCASPIEYSNDEGKRRLLHRISTKGIPDLCKVPGRTD
ncbi:MAG: TauD/TfdA dioxygenase family protein [Gammaproteobacteria bacterium]